MMRSPKSLQSGKLSWILKRKEEKERKEEKRKKRRKEKEKRKKRKRTKEGNLEIRICDNYSVLDGFLCSLYLVLSSFYNI